jgi:hypothetical protein
VLYQPGFAGIVDDISAIFQKLFLLFYQPGLITALENGSSALVFPVVKLTVQLVEELHSFCQVRIGGFYQEMVVIAHKTVGVTDPVKLFSDPGLEPEEFHPVLGIVKDRHLADAPVYDMVKGTFEFNT